MAFIRGWAVLLSVALSIGQLAMCLPLPLAYTDSSREVTPTSITLRGSEPPSTAPKDDFVQNNADPCGEEFGGPFNQVCWESEKETDAFASEWLAIPKGTQILENLVTSIFNPKRSDRPEKRWSVRDIDGVKEVDNSLETGDHKPQGNDGNAEPSADNWAKEQFKTLGSDIDGLFTYGIPAFLGPSDTTVSIFKDIWSIFDKRDGWLDEAFGIARGNARVWGVSLAQPYMQIWPDMKYYPKELWDELVGNGDEQKPPPEEGGRPP